MRIVKITLSGFKSFAREETFDFSSGVTAIVGPNGCGKSNVIDAVKWVLGEQSRKDLRMKDSTDVIFGGTQSRKAAKHAEITIVFDNASGHVKNAGAEFSITRRLTTGGESSYAINGNEAKLRDLRELLAGTGIGPDGYTIMEQGKIDALLQTNPEERRRVFEEAAGIGLYRAQRASTETKLQVVAQNLERLTDKINEARSRLRSIKGQASRALKFKELTERLRILRTRLSIRSFHKLGREREELLIRVNDIGREEGRLAKLLTTVGMELESVAAKLGAGESRLEEMKGALHACELEIGQREGKRSESKARIDGLKRASERLESDISRLNEQIAAFGARKAELDASAKEAAKRLEETASVLDSLTSEESRFQEEGRNLEKGVKGLRDAHLEHLSGRNALMNERLRIEAETKATAQRRLRLERRTGELEQEIQSLDAATEKLTALNKADNAKLATLKDDYDGAEKKVGKFNALLSESRGERHKLEMRISGCASRIAHLEEVTRMLDGIEAGSRELFQNKDDAARFGIQGLLAELVTADISVAPALERALGPLASALVVDTAEHAFEAFDHLARKDGQAATVVISEFFKYKFPLPNFPEGQGVLGPLAEQVKIADGFEPLVTRLIGEWLLVADRDVARRLSAKTPDLRMVTPTGEVFGRGHVSVPSSDRSGGIVTQRSELERLRREHEELTESARALGAKIDEAVAEAQAANRLVEELRASIYEASIQTLESRTELDHLARRTATLKEEATVVESESGELSKAASEAGTRLSEIEGELEKLTAAISSVEQDIDRAADARADWETRRNDLNDRLTHQRVAAAEARSNLKAIEQTAAELESAAANFARQADEDRKDLVANQRETKRLESELSRLDSGESELHQRREELGKNIQSLDGELVSIRAQAEAMRIKEREHNQQLIASKESATSLKVEEERRFLAQNNLRDRMLEEYSIDLDAVYRDYNPDADDLDEKAAHDESEALMHSIKHLGNVNMEAVDELEQVEQHYNACSKQEKDLLRAKQALEDAIQRIESEARRRYITTFETVRGHFQRLFRKLFNGGSADIILLNPENVLESGVEVIAKPPGMEPKTLSLLSGGQRSMIAVALMFSLFETSSAPFALLDEVDAALDDANVERFCTLLSEYAEQAQFIVITHHKRTMIAAGQLYGVTMQEQGISKKVGVNLDEYEPEPQAQAESEAEATATSDASVPASAEAVTA